MSDKDALRTPEPCESRLVDSPAAWDACAAELSGVRRLAVDMEADGFHAYRDRVCLIQLATDSRVFLLDPLAIPDISLLGRLFADPRVEIVLHSGDYDIRSFDRDFDFRIRGLFDTSIAASFLGGTMLGLAAVVAAELGVEVPKTKSMQRRDWGRRPLPADALRYAAHDVCHLLELRDRQMAKLEQLGRVEWVREECARLEKVRFEEPPNPRDACLQVRGVGRLRPAVRSVFRELYLLRDEIARSRNIPAFKIASNALLMEIAAQPNSDFSGHRALQKGLGRVLARGLDDALQRGRSAPPLQMPNHGTRPRPAAGVTERLNRLKQWRRKTAEGQHIDPALIWPMKSLESLARSGARTLDGHGADADVPVRRWQRTAFGASLNAYLATSVREPPETPKEGAAGRRETPDPP